MAQCTGGHAGDRERRLEALIRRLRAEFPAADAWLDEHQVQDRAGTAKDLRHEEAAERLGQLALVHA